MRAACWRSERPFGQDDSGRSWARALRWDTRGAERCGSGHEVSCVHGSAGQASRACGRSGMRGAKNRMVPRRQRGQSVRSEPGRVGRHQQGPVLEVPRRREEAPDLLPAEHLRQPPGGPAGRDRRGDVRAAQRLRVEEPNACTHDVDRRLGANLRSCISLTIRSLSSPMVSWLQQRADRASPADTHKEAVYDRMAGTCRLTFPSPRARLRRHSDHREAV